MFNRSILVVYFMVVSICSLPLQMQLLQPLQQHIPMQPPIMQTQQASLQQQLLALQQLQALQRLNTIHSPSELYLPQPLLILLPKPPTKDMIEKNENLKNANKMDPKETDFKYNNSDKEYTDEDSDSVILDAEPDPIEIEPQRAIILFPNGRLSIGDIISSIPWLPFEINVPDTIAWAYNGISSGISGIISIIGQRLPIRPRTQMVTGQETSMKMFLKQLQTRNHDPTMPILVMPIDMTMIPTQM